MMLKRKIKISLAGLFSLLLMALAYIAFSPKTEIIADESLRIEEPLNPGIESQVDRAVNANTIQPKAIAAGQFESLPDDSSIEQATVNSHVELPSSLENPFDNGPIVQELSLIHI